MIGDLAVSNNWVEWQLWCQGGSYVEALDVHPGEYAQDRSRQCVCATACPVGLKQQGTVQRNQKGTQFWYVQLVMFDCGAALSICGQEMCRGRGQGAAAFPITWKAWCWITPLTCSRAPGVLHSHVLKRAEAGEQGDSHSLIIPRVNIGCSNIVVADEQAPDGIRTRFWSCLLPCDLPAMSKKISPLCEPLNSSQMCKPSVMTVTWPC